MKETLSCSSEIAPANFNVVGETDTLQPTEANSKMRESTVNFD